MLQAAGHAAAHYPPHPKDVRRQGRAAAVVNALSCARESAGWSNGGGAVRRGREKAKEPVTQEAQASFPHSVMICSTYACVSL
jgi:hypothetical protein